MVTHSFKNNIWNDKGYNLKVEPSIYNFLLPCVNWLTQDTNSKLKKKIFEGLLIWRVSGTKEHDSTPMSYDVKSTKWLSVGREFRFLVCKMVPSYCALLSLPTF